MISNFVVHLSVNKLIINLFVVNDILLTDTNPLIILTLL